ncbi:unnamed protein product [Soboliphyme baturini]|uniref:Apple domain-containing protein n=1 Tax=Soboliphyme baturini TaxID=241478 RepID=A0A183IUA7_9BILA|nr:unnamed protein product [Soboliphyme baturini]
MSDEERRRFHDALQKLRHSKIDGVSKEEVLLIAFQQATGRGSDYGTAFLPLHRHFLNIIERALRTEDPQVALPYCDFSLDGALNQAADSVLWAKNLYGLYSDSNYRILNLSRIIRELKYPFKTNWMFKPFQRCVDPFYETASLRYPWIGGYQLHDAANRVFDPLLLLYHSFVEFLWETVRNDQSSDLSKCRAEYRLTVKNTHHLLGSLDSLLNSNTTVAYEYEPRPKCSLVDPLCKSDYLFCFGMTVSCISKIRLGGNCSGFEEEPDACYGSFCFNGQCNIIDDEMVQPEVSRPHESDSEVNVGQKEKKCDCLCNISRPATPPAEKLAHHDAKNPNANVPHQVWFTVTVLSGLLPAKTKYRVMANVEVEGLTYEENFSGVVFERSTYPFYLGATLVPVKNPQLAEDKRTISWISVTAEKTKKPCETFCYNPSSKIYKSCDAEMVLEYGPGANSTVPYFADAMEAVYYGWNNDTSARAVDHFLFLCKYGGEEEHIEADTQHVQDVRQCTFERWDNYLLIGFAAAVFRNVDLQVCKRLCAANEMGVECASLIYWPMTENCVLNSESRLTKPNLFEKFPTQDVVYMDYYCEDLKPYE